MLDLFDEVPDQYIPRDSEEEPSEYAKNFSSCLSQQSEKPMAKFSVARSVATDRDKQINSVRQEEGQLSEVVGEYSPKEPVPQKGQWTLTNKVTINKTRSTQPAQDPK